MPAAYAHIRFGKAQTLPGKYGMLPKNFPQLYTVGLQGPDLLFYHNPVFPTSAVREGQRLHTLSGQAFFAQAIAAYKAAPSDGALAYLFGVLGHYCLDSRAHPLINQLVESEKINHVALETEFDRFLQQRDGLILLQNRRIGKYLRLTRGERATVAGFYKDLGPASIGWCLGNMRRVYRIAFSRKRKLAKMILGLGGETGRSLIPTVGPDPRCAHLDAPLLESYEAAARDYPQLAQELIAAIETDAPLGEAFAPTFG